jgi:hypothetical protein
MKGRPAFEVFEIWIPDDEIRFHSAIGWRKFHRFKVVCYQVVSDCSKTDFKEKDFQGLKSYISWTFKGLNWRVEFKYLW